MEIFRTDKLDILKYIAPNITTTPDEPVLVTIDNIAKNMIEHPDYTCISVAFDGADLIGYAVAWVVRDHIWIDQAWTSVDYSREEVGKKILEVIKVWALENDIHDIRFETTRSTKALTRAWGFEEFSSIMKMEI